MKIKATEIRKGMILEIDGDLYYVHSFTHLTPGKGQALVQTKLKNLQSGRMIDKRFSSDDKVEKASLEQREMQYLYQDGDTYYFMNMENYEQISLPKDLLGDSVNFLKPDIEISVNYYNGEPVSVELPIVVELEVIETEPGLKNATVSNVNKPAKLETGVIIQVPQFINEGDIIKVNTQTGEYISRA